MIIVACLLITASAYNLQLSDITNDCGTLGCAVNVAFQVKVNQPAGVIEVHDSYRNFDHPLEIIDSLNYYKITTTGKDVIYDADVSEKVLCNCPPSNIAQAPDQDCKPYSTWPMTPVWNINIEPAYENRNFDCEFSNALAKCCYAATFRTTQMYDIRTGLSSALLETRVKYKNKEYSLIKGVKTDLGDVNVTLDTMNVEAAYLNDIYVAFDPYGRTYNLWKKDINSPGEKDPAKAGYWKQDTAFIKEGVFGYLPEIASTRYNTFVSRLKPKKLMDYKEANATFVPIWTDRPGKKISQGELVKGWEGGNRISVLFGPDKPNFFFEPGFNLVTDSGVGEPVTLCFFHPYVYACDPVKNGVAATSFDISFSDSRMGYLTAVINRTETKVFLNGYGEILTSTRQQLEGLTYNLRPDALTLTIQSNSIIPPILLGDCIPLTIIGVVTGEKWAATVTAKDGKTCSFLLQDNERIQYVQGSQSNILISGNKSLTVRDTNGNSMFDIAQVKTPTDSNPKTFLGFHIDLTDWKFWISVVIWIAALAFLKWLGRFEWLMVLIMIFAIGVWGIWSLFALIAVAVLGWRTSLSNASVKAIGSMKKSLGKNEDKKEEPLLTEMKVLGNTEGQPVQNQGGVDNNNYAPETFQGTYAQKPNGEQAVRAVPRGNQTNHHGVTNFGYTTGTGSVNIDFTSSGVYTPGINHRRDDILRNY